MDTLKPINPQDQSNRPYSDQKALYKKTLTKTEKRTIAKSIKRDLKVEEEKAQKKGFWGNFMDKVNGYSHEQITAQQNAQSRATLAMSRPSIATAAKSR